MILPDWLQALRRLRAAGRPAVLVTVAEVRGSVPREAGARMVVGHDGIVGTIGGGHLEWQATAIARRALAGDPDAAGTGPRRFPLGASLGQCCGGIVTLWFEPLAFDRLGFGSFAPQADPAAWLDALAEALARGETLVLECRGGADAQAGRRLSTARESADRRREFADRVSGGSASGPWLDRDPVDGRPVLIDPIGPSGRPVALFGAGHVGRALAPILAGCGLQLIWIDARGDAFATDRAAPDGIDCRAGDDPVAEVATLPGGCHGLVMTHSHALDQLVVEAFLRRDDLGWLGLIGSATKRRRFEARLLARGVAAARIAAMDCPVTVPGITGKAPGVVAVAIAARLLQVLDAPAPVRDGPAPAWHGPAPTSGGQ